MKLPLFEYVNKMLHKRAKWKALNAKTRKFSATLLVCSLYCLIAALTCAVAVVYRVPQVEIFHFLGLSSTFTWVTLTFMALASNAAGVIISRAERYHRLAPAAQKCAKGVLVARLPSLCVASHRSGNARAHRSPSRSQASKDSSGDGESDSGEGDPPASPALSLSLIPYLTFTSLFYKLNNFPLLWRFLFAIGCWCMVFDPLFAEMGWRK